MPEQRTWRLFLLLCPVLTVIFLSGCSSIENSHRQKSPYMEAYISGNNMKISSEIKNRLGDSFWSSTVGTGDELMWRLEAGSINFHLGNFKESIAQFTKAEELIAQYDERALISARDVGSEGAGILTNMNALPYRGFCRDRIALAMFKSIAYLGMDRESSFRAQLKRLRNEHKKVQEDFQSFFDAEKEELRKAKLKNASVAQKKNPEMTPDQLARDPRNREFAQSWSEVQTIAHRGYGNFLNPAAIFLSGLGAMRDGNLDNARIEFKRLYEAMPNNPMFQQYYVTILRKTGRSIPPELRKVKPFSFPLDQNCVYVIFANGRGPAFRQISIYFPIMTAWPVCEFYPAAFQRLRAKADLRQYYSHLLSDMDGVIAQEFQKRLPGIIARIILNTAVKEAAYYAALAAANQIQDARARAIAMISVAAIGTTYRIAVNTADTRSWELLPKEFQLTQFPMPKNRTVKISLEGSAAKELSVKIPGKARSAIIYVSAPSERNIRYHVFPMCSDMEASMPPAVEMVPLSAPQKKAGKGSGKGGADNLSADASAAVTPAVVREKGKVASSENPA